MLDVSTITIATVGAWLRSLTLSDADRQQTVEREREQDAGGDRQEGEVHRDLGTRDGDPEQDLRDRVARQHQAVAESTGLRARGVVILP